MIAEDLGDKLVLRPLDDDPVQQALGVFRRYRGPTADEMRKLDRLEEAWDEDRRDRPQPGDEAAQDEAA